jgi:hypothetical protein
MTKLVVDIERAPPMKGEGRLELFVPDEMITDRSGEGFIDASKIAESVTKIAAPQSEPVLPKEPASDAQNTINKRVC